MNFQAEPVTINTLLSVNKRYFIPRYQRDFSWTKENIDELWSDLVSSIEKNDNNTFTCEEYFIGTLVLAGRDDSFEVEVVDGQQRLSVITMFISAICRELYTSGSERAATSTFETFIKGVDRQGNSFTKLDKRSQTNFFSLLIQDLVQHNCEASSEEDALVKSAYIQITKLISKPSLKKTFNFSGRYSDTDYINTLNALIDLIADHLKVIRVNVLNNDDAYTIFEILNARGINLSPVDLIKNKILQEWDGTYPIDFAKTKWNEIISLLSSREVSAGLEEYSIHHWTTKFAYTSKRNLYKAFKKQWVLGNITADVYLNELHEDCQIYIKIISPQLGDWPQVDQRAIYNSLTALRIFNVSIMRSFLLSLFKARNSQIITQRVLIQTLSKIENFHFMFNAICSLRPSGIEGLYAKCARNLYYAETRRDATLVIDELTNTLEQKRPTRESFISKFKQLQFLNENTINKKLIQYIFTKMERLLRENIEFEPNDLSLEHISSQVDTNISSQIKGSIGNLLPLGQDINSRANTRTFTAKKAIYRNSDYRIVESFLLNNPQSTWDEQDINRRTMNLAEMSYDVIWH
ncbi:DUF262 domain-containing HNH endonuclease family protein [Enterobacter kobei]|uniref:DUF262 domain-containing protein n=1 Tax=Enterobacter kobei TaxID=208224 RepID=UPI000C1F4837|nr:DUF262 domain-containing protein [Enterobacter kobei]MBT1799983.1 DUF262 domain-containing protein [Enterobacter kobei]MBW7697779.1 DUF262 domain-containing HNH endonuclease family protein [Enterobacter kobei]MBW7774111.1 DUF262 domain-containing HNH endonuclease family protein [Enterobacter kobei]MCK6865067.1 DUF262 domain-containing HNH endonuclease family protein [Enterobacter kobei]MCO7421376.1 DUF262 domain-containing HNH endonuclease family protein [Enterobacter kobei]